ncbi:chromosome segregation protein SMC [Sulfurospirillum sp. 1612]|uniref:chromosome segregation protein SMC n=1 Tax=Sulfurospirillum sp. 1612 TaxID=3094835 RepID=UPI002F92D117
MIERLYLREHFSFKDCELHFAPGLIAFTGPSGAGKSVLMQAILSLFGFSDAKALLIEATVLHQLDMEAYGIVNEPANVFKLMRSKTTRYFVNSQNISKKSINELSKNFLSYLSVKDNGEFENERLLEFLDAICTHNHPPHRKNLKDFKAKYDAYKTLDNALKTIQEKENKIEELKEFAKFEINKINDIDPKIGEDETLMSLKKSLSKKEKMQTALDSAYGIFDFESNVIEALQLIETESTFFDECMNELRNQFEIQKDLLNNLEDIDIETMLDRIEKIASLKKRHGSIEAALAYKEEKIKELEAYENISFEKQNLEKKYAKARTEVEHLAQQLSKTRGEQLEIMNQRINHYLQMLYMPSVRVESQQKELDDYGIDALVVNLGSVEVKKISSGEYNRLRLAFLAAREEFLRSDGGVLILDEIDSNLSGKESMSVAKVLEVLSQKYQIFAISHQPQLSSRADMHFLVSKDDHGSHVRLLDKEERVEELARMVSGEKIHEAALEFASSLMAGNKD